MIKTAQAVVTCLVIGLAPFILSSTIFAQDSVTALLVDDNRVECPGASFSTISAAVAAAADGDTVEVCTGAYTGPIAIAKNLTLRATAGGSGVVVEGPIVATGPIIVAIEGLTINGRGLTPFGIRVDREAVATVRNNKIRNVVIGIQVGRFAESTSATATINNNLIEGYGKDGILISNFGSSATVVNNRIVGAGATTTGQNGIEVADGATATITGNEIRDNFHLSSQPAGQLLCPSPAEPSFSAGGCLGITAAGILLFNAGGAGTERELISQNTLIRNQVNVFVFPP